MVKKKKYYRKVNDRNFLAIADMPLMETKADAIQWIKSSEAVRYVFKLCRNHYAVMANHQEDDSYLWEGINFDSDTREWENLIKTGYGEMVSEAIYKDEIDLMPPLHHKFSNQKFDLFKSEVVQFLIEKNNIFNLIFVNAAHNGLIKTTENFNFIGKNQIETDELEAEKEIMLTHGNI